nr:hypothetical protein [Pedobacter sp. ASV19]
MKTILLFFAGFLMLQVQAQQTKITLIHNFKGKIDQYPVEINLRSNLQNDTITGSYYYTKKGRDKNIFLEGTLKNNTLTLKEVVYTTLNGNSIKKHLATLNYY